MADSSEGVRRLSIFAGSIITLLWLVYFFRNATFDGTDPTDWLFFIVITVGFFFFGLALVRAVAWVIQGFTRK